MDSKKLFSAALGAVVGGALTYVLIKKQQEKKQKLVEEK